MTEAFAAVAMVGGRNDLDRLHPRRCLAQAAWTKVADEGQMNSKQVHIPEALKRRKMHFRVESQSTVPSADFPWQDVVLLQCRLQPALRHPAHHWDGTISFLYIAEVQLAPMKFQETQLQSGFLSLHLQQGCREGDVQGGQGESGQALELQ